MADQADRERESRESDTTKFEDIRREDEAERVRVAEELAAERLQDEQQPEQNEP
ncbi:MAG TPA: hypothetical protein VF236_06210 [Gaiellaceae bacterium]